MQKRVLAIHDISCVGRCSITVALPIISACGIECSILPTALLSTHTGDFRGYTFLDLSGEMEKILDHWASVDITFDAIYTGYLGSPDQVRTVSRAVSMFPGAKLIVDTVMGDKGHMYSGLSDEFTEVMRSLTSMADIITPNATEAALLLGEEYHGEVYDEETAADTARRLADHTAGGAAVLTGVVKGGEIGAVACENGEVTCSFTKKEDGFFHGTGDVFASALVAGLMTGHRLTGSLAAATEFTHRSIEECIREGRPAKFGVPFEKALPGLVKTLTTEPVI